MHAPGQQAVAVSAGGLLAHAVYGMADAITLWDRFAFVFWIMLGLLAAQYWLVQANASVSLSREARS